MKINVYRNCTTLECGRHMKENGDTVNFVSFTLWQKNKGGG